MVTSSRVYKNGANKLGLKYHKIKTSFYKTNVYFIYKFKHVKQRECN